jgi:hypothetical protein
MYSYAKIKNGEIITFPYSFDELTADNPGKVFTGVIDIMQLFLESDLPSLGYELVNVEYPLQEPFVQPYEKFYRVDKPVFEDGKWVYKWIVENLTNEELAEKFNLPLLPK